MNKRARSRSELYGTSQVAEILNIPEWRIKNFSEGKAYRLPPAKQVGRGRGSRRLYEWADIYRLLIANELVGMGFIPEAVGQAVREVPESKLISRDILDEDSMLLVLLHGDWAVIPAKSLKEISKRNSIAIVPFQQIISNLHADIKQRFHRQFLRDHYPEIFGEVYPSEE
jgi:hypothetical protein